MTNTTREVLINVPANNDNLRMRVHDRETDSDLLQLMFKAVGIVSPYQIYYGKSIYAVDDIVFYTEEGEKPYRTKCGWFEGAYSKRFRAISFDIPDKWELKKVTEITTDKLQKLYKSNAIFFTSLGKDWSGENKAVLYIPMTYLEGLGYQVIKTTTEGEYSISEETKLYTPLFQIYVANSREKLYGNIRLDMIKDLEGRIPTEDDLKSFINKWDSII